MADALTCIKSPTEAIQEFNLRLREECKKLEPTRVLLSIVHGEPMLTLLAETVEADEEDVEDAQEHNATIEGADGKPRPIKVGDEIPAGDLVCVKVSRVAAYEGEKERVASLEKRKRAGTQDMEISALSELRLDKLYEQADGLINDHLHASGPVPAPTARYLGEMAHWVAVVYVPLDEEDAKALDAKGESDLRS